MEERDEDGVAFIICPKTTSRMQPHWYAVADEALRNSLDLKR
jgi:hypothetical protein